MSVWSTPRAAPRYAITHLVVISVLATQDLALI